MSGFWVLDFLFPQGEFLSKNRITYYKYLSICGRERNLESYRLCTPVLFFVSQAYKKLSQVFKSSRKAVTQLFFSSQNKNTFRCLLFVGERGLEPPLLAERAPKARVSANFTTRPVLWLFLVFFLNKQPPYYNT